MKFIHTADIHWGMVPDSDRPWGKKREQAIRLTLQTIVEEARENHVDLLLISGDLFHRQPLWFEKSYLPSYINLRAFRTHSV